MNFVELKRLLLFLGSIMLLSGCTATYDLDISNAGISESLIISPVSVDNLDYFVPAYYNSIGEDDYDVDINQKIEGIEYYNTSFGDNIINFNYNFTNANFLQSNIVNGFYSTFIFRKYDYDEDGVEDYYLLTTTDDFSAFDLYKELDEVTVRIKNDFEVISSNADEVDGKIYTWHLSPDDISSINMVYDPDKEVDYRTFWEKVKDGEYFSVFIFALIIFVVGIIGYLLLKKKGELRDRV